MRRTTRRGYQGTSELLCRSEALGLRPNRHHNGATCASVRVKQQMRQASTSGCWGAGLSKPMRSNLSASPAPSEA
jgi:hypothetical protein